MLYDFSMYYQDLDFGFCITVALKTKKENVIDGCKNYKRGVFKTKIYYICL